MKQQHINNHFVPQFYLKNWSNDNKKIWVYNNLVTSSKVPLWSEKSIKKIAYLPHLYTKVEENQESDEIELWFNEEYENPAKIIFEKLNNDYRLSHDDYSKLARFTALQSMRTLFAYRNYCDLAKKSFDNALVEVKEKLDKIAETKIIPTINSNKDNDDKDKYPLKTKIIKGDEQSYIYVETLVARKTWLNHIQHILNKFEPILQGHKWSIIKMSDKVELPTSDNPVILLNYYGKDNYDFKGGWGKKGGEILLPLSPHYLFYTQIQTDYSISNLMENEQFSLLVKKLIIQNSFLQVFAKNKIKYMFSIKPRTVDEHNYKRIYSMMDNWHNNQTFGEEDFYSDIDLFDNFE